MKTMERFDSGRSIRQVLARRVTAAWLVAGVALALAQPARAGRVTASGGTEMYHTQNGTNYHAHIFRTTGTDTFTVTQGGEMEVLVVAGGGGGGQWNAGGGGAGGLIYTSTVVEAGSYSVTVGSGGAGGVGGVRDEEGRSGSNGSDSAFGAFTAIGGGGGGAYNYNAGLPTSGGSGGGGGAAPVPTYTATGVPGQGHDGGVQQNASVYPYAGAGGGGAGDVGGSANPGNGGAGLYYAQFAFAGSPAGWFAGGGGGGGNSGSGAGGIGGGGAGQNGTSPSSGGISGVAGTGGGGGGGGGTKVGPGGPGGSGIVIIQYPVLTASGGTEMSYTQNGTNYHAHIFRTTGTSTFTVTQGGEMEVLVVAGGGGGGQWNAGGGGAGGLIYTSTVVDAGSYSVTVGSGGAGGVGGTNPNGNSGSNGSDSVFGAFTAIGGGGGGAYSAGLATSGGSGGGGGWIPGGALIALGIAGQGHDGGAGQGPSSGVPYAGAGGGGAGAVGGSANPGNGGAGLEFPQFASFGGSPAGWFAGGGGGGGNSASGAGGIGGGGAGQNQETPATGGIPGVAGTGGGGGGGGSTGKGPGGDGGSGIVIVRYVLPQPRVDNWVLATGGTETNFMENGTNYHAHIFTETGTSTFYVYAGGAVEYLVVGGGGAGRGNGSVTNSGSGGNGGEFHSGVIYDVPAGVMSVTVGAGGVGAVNASGGPGGASAFWTITAAGGAGGSFGSSSVGTYGGNGAGGPGAGHGDGPLGNAGGPGFASTILGTSVMYAGGGGGGFSHGGNAGSGGGGRGESYNTGTAESGVANTGGGGGGVSNGGATPGKNGGSGIVIIRYQRPLPSDNLINLDINGYGSGGDPVPVTAKTCYGAAAVGAAGDFWNSAAIKDSTLETLEAPLLKKADGITSTTVRFTLSKPNGLLHADWRHEPGYAVTNLLDDYVYILPGDTPASDTFTISGLVPNATYDLYFYSHAGIEYTPGRFTINGIEYDSIYNWATTGDYAKCLGIAADGNGVITGTFSQADPNNAAVLNGLQIVGDFPVSQAEIVNIDLNGFYGDNWLGAASTYVGAARVGWAGDYWNGMAVYDGSLSVTAPNLKLANGTTNTTVSFSLSSTVGGGKLHGNGRTSLNAMLNEYVFITDGTSATDGSSDRFTIAGLVPNATYDLYFYCHEHDLYNPGRFVINGKTYDSIDTSFPASGGGDTAICAGITADGNGQIIGEFSQAAAPLPVVVNGLQIVGAFPRRQADLVNIDINGYGPGNTGPENDPPPVEGDTYSGAARVGADGDYWNGLAIGTESVTNITVSRLKFADGATKSRVSFTVGRVDGLLQADRIVPQVYLNSLMGDYVYYYNATGTVTVAGLYPNTAYDLYFYCNAGSLYFPTRFEINGATYDSFDNWFAGSTYGDYAVCAGIVSDASGSISGTFYKAAPGSATCVCGVQIMGRIPLAPQGTVILFR